MAKKTKFSKNYNNLLITMQNIGSMSFDKNSFTVTISSMPLIKKSLLKEKLLEQDKTGNLYVTNFTNLKSVRNKNNTIIEFFDNDDVLKRIINNPLKYVSSFDGFLAVATPDYSVYQNSNNIKILSNTFDSRWTGSFWQSHGLNIIPTVSWAKDDTYDICFSGIEKKSIVMISTLSVLNNQDTFQKFMNGFLELKKRIDPSLIIVVGQLLEGMEGEFLVYSLKDTFTQNPKVVQLSFIQLSHYVKVENGVVHYGR